LDWDSEIKRAKPAVVSGKAALLLVTTKQPLARAYMTEIQEVSAKVFGDANILIEGNSLAISG
jgi:argininosuccinate lyase